MRLFIAVDIARNALVESFEAKLNKCTSELKMAGAGNLHLTLKFFGETNKDPADIEQVMKVASKGINKFNLILEGCGVFPNRSYIRVIWIGMKDSEELKKLASRLDIELENLGFKKEQRSFSPHLTIARVKSRKGKEELIKVLDEFNGVRFGEIKVNSIKLYKSTLLPKGPVYTKLKEIRLG
jgi:2'-5' RNA ligase